MKKIALLSSALLFTFSSVFAQNWALDKVHSKLGFSIGYLGIADFEGSFKSVDAIAKASKPDFSDLSVELTADINSVNTENEQRDGHLKSPDFFDAAQFSTFTFKSTGIKKIKDKQYKLTGNLTLHGVTKVVDLTLTYNGTTTNPNSKKTIAGFKVSGSINRSDFNLGANFPPTMLTNEVKLDANIIVSAAS